MLNAFGALPEGAKNARIDITEAMAMAPKPAGLTGRRYARLNSMYGGLSPSGLLVGCVTQGAVLAALVGGQPGVGAPADALR